MMENQKYSVQAARLRAEAGEDIHALKGSQKKGKLALLHRWLYGELDWKVTYRMAPSIIVRSETELLGITSPRFAIRAYLGRNSFANIRRRKVTRNQIRQAHSDDLATELIDAIGKDKAQWIADSLLAPPQRLEAAGFQFITCDFAKDYGEMEAITGHIPFVTHLEVGGGLCAQAATFMALCLAESKTIYGIAEITKLASPNPQSFDIHGLTPDSIVDLLSHETIALNGLYQRQVAARQNSRRLVHNALRSYCLSQIPSLVCVSISRLWGGHRKTMQGGFAPIIRSGETRVDEQDYSKLPLGFGEPFHEYFDRKVKDTTRDHHVVVVVGASPDALAINDPATFPFITCNIDQLFDARSYEFTWPERKPDRLLSRADLAPLSVISVVPAKVRMPLIGVQEKRNGLLTQLQGLLDFISEVHDTGEIAGLSYRDAATMPCRETPLKLVRVVTTEEHGKRLVYVADKADVPLPDDVLEKILHPSSGTALASEYYWVHHIQLPDTDQKTVETIWFWDAEREFFDVDRSFSGLLFKKDDQDAWQGADGTSP